MKDIPNSKYTIFVNDIEKILSIILKCNENINIDYIDYDTDPAIYYCKSDNLYLINYDSIENKWYLSLINKNTFKLIKEIYNASFEDFIKFLQNKKSHWIIQ